jgi:NADPH-dependent curcumin reductase CurA
MKKLLIALSVAAGALLVGAAPAGAAGSICYDLQANVNGDQVVAESGCQELPAP